MKLRRDVICPCCRQDFIIDDGDSDLGDACAIVIEQQVQGDDTVNPLPMSAAQQETSPEQSVDVVN